MANAYSVVPRLQRMIGSTTTDADELSDLLLALEQASRTIDDLCGYPNRHFYVETATRDFDGPSSGRFSIPDVLSVSSLTADTDGDAVFDDESWVEGTDFQLWPYNRFPKTEIETLADGNYAIGEGQRRYRISGEWGYGDGSSDPKTLTGTTGTVSDATSATLTLSVSGEIGAGHTILIDSERLYVKAVSGTTATVERGVNGSTAAAHTNAPIYVYRVPAVVEKVCLWLASKMLADVKSGGLKFENIANEYSYTAGDAPGADEFLLRSLGSFIRRDA